ncbi:MAG: bifunctional DNA-formamidopyrimidine glycosylase/DNA-(apurinic or apyrimidinic site) lyase [Patescibacteria group bacterium]|nr:bifunctional DNA-formamidopyrimidine glycosylase/DNA-(apurinic or apyrimidinic site) lyase [Patescibacteria group bacterium]
MPELPEVETIVRDLNSNLSGRTIKKITSTDKKVFQLTSQEAKTIIGATVKAVRRRAKMIIIDLGEAYLLIHLKMTGQLVLKNQFGLIAGGHPILNQGPELPNKFSRVIFQFNDQSRLFFNDVRRFAWVRLISRPDFAKLEAELGIEPLSGRFTLEYFKKVLARRKSTVIKQVLMDQQQISGVGNIYADEVLFRAGVKPSRRANTLKPQEIRKIWQAIPGILRLAIKHRGTSFSDYVDARGAAGNFVKYLQVYGRAGEKCRRCGRIIKKMKLGGRGTQWCDYCQK